MAIGFQRKTTAYLVSGLESLDLFKIFGVSPVGIVKGSLEFADVCLVFLFDARDFGLVAGLNLDKSAL